MVNKMKKQIVIDNNSILALLIKLFIIITVLIPFVTKLDSKNTNYILGNVVCFLFMIITLFRNEKNNKHRTFFLLLGVLIIVYNIVFGYYNLYFHKYYIEQINETVSFLFLLVLLRKFDRQFFEEYKIIRFLFRCIIITCILSLIFYFLGGDALTLDNTGVIIRKQGYFTDNRLTWVFGHKSAYGLLLSLFLSTVLRYKNQFKFKINYFISLVIIIITILFTGSTTTILLSIAAMIGILLTKQKLRSIGINTFIILLFSLLPMYFYNDIYNFIDKSRNISTVGQRTYIYEAAKYYLSLYPNGIGKSFGNFIMTQEIMTIDNLHNIFINQMLRFSIIVGSIYFIIFVFILSYSIIKKKMFAGIIWIMCFGLFFMDNSLTTDHLSLFIFLIYLLFFND